MPDKCKTSVIIPIFEGKADVMSCGSYRGVKLLEHAMKIVERVLERRIRTLVILNETKFGFMPGKGRVDAIFVVKRIQEEYQKKDKKLYMRFVDMEKAFDRLPRKVMEWAMRKKGLSEVMVRAVMSLYDGAKTRVRVGSAYSEEFESSELQQTFKVSIISCRLSFYGIGAVVAPSESKNLPPTKQNSLNYRNQSSTKYICRHTTSKINVGLLVNRRLLTAHNLEKQISTSYSVKVTSFSMVCFKFIGSLFEIRPWSAYQNT